jgi:hypothetical protein
MANNNLNKGNLGISEASLFQQLASLYCGYSGQHTTCSQMYKTIKENLSLFSNYLSYLTQGNILV